MGTYDKKLLKEQRLEEETSKPLKAITIMQLLILLITYHGIGETFFSSEGNRYDKSVYSVGLQIRRLCTSRLEPDDLELIFSLLRCHRRSSKPYLHQPNLNGRCI